MEIFDLYDGERRPTGKTMVRGTDVPEGYYRLVLHICIFNSKGEMLIQQRQPFKRGWPGLWDVSLGGSISQGETSRIAAERELAEELGLKYDFSDKVPALTVSFRDGFDDIYILHMDIPVSDIILQESEVKAVMWADRDTIMAMIDDQSFIPYEKHFMDYLFFLKDTQSTHTEPDRRNNGSDI